MCLGCRPLLSPTTSGYRACSTPDMKTAPQDAQAQATHLCGDGRPQRGSAKEVGLRGCCGRWGLAGWPPRGFALVDTRGGLELLRLVLARRGLLVCTCAPHGHSGQGREGTFPCDVRRANTRLHGKQDLRLPKCACSLSAGDEVPCRTLTEHTRVCRSAVSFWLVPPVS